jgi:hypothetical protein
MRWFGLWFQNAHERQKEKTKKTEPLAVRRSVRVKHREQRDGSGH